jgi:hypothetical protein
LPSQSLKKGVDQALRALDISSSHRRWRLWVKEASWLNMEIEGPEGSLVQR